MPFYARKTVGELNINVPLSESEPASRPGLFERFRASFRKGRSTSTTPECDPLDESEVTCDDGEDKENACVEPAVQPECVEPAVLPGGVEPRRESKEENKEEVQQGDSMSDVIGDDDADEIFSDGSGNN
eukprot:sb/3475317/